MIRNIHKQAEFWVFLPMFLVLLPHYSRLPLWMTILLPVFFIWRLLAIHSRKLLPNKFLLTLISLLTLAGTLLHYGTIFGKTAGTSLLCILLGTKLLESKNRRDYMLLVSLATFVVVTHFLFSQSIPTVIYMFTMVMLLIMSLISMNQGAKSIPIKTRFKITSSLVIYALPVMLVLFLLFPRISGSIWQLPEDRGSSITGLSDTMSPGLISQLIQSDAIAFRAKFKNNPPSQNNLYWRGFILWFFDGQIWSKGKTNKNPSASLEAFSRETEYTVTLEPHNKKWIFAIDMPVRHSKEISFTGNYVLKSGKNIDSIYQYTVKSYLDYRIGLNLSNWEQIAGLQLPVNSNRRTIQLGIEWKNKYKTPEAIINQALKHFNRENFIYTLEPPLTPGFDPVDQFLFETRKGFCEHYTSSFTLLMRAAGIPARVVIGYQGGTINPINNYLSIRQNDAHAWSEVWLQDKGWIRVDPTAAVAPERIELNLDAALNPDESRPLYMQFNTGFLKQMKFYWDAIDNSWKQLIISYDSKKQREILARLLNKNINYYDIVLTLIISISIIALIISLLIVKPVSLTKEDPAEKVYRKFCKKMARRGLVKPAHEGPADFSARAVNMFPEKSDTINFFIDLYINSRYRSRQSKQQIDKMKKLFRRL